jgi:hypothetical protein
MRLGAEVIGVSVRVRGRLLGILLVAAAFTVSSSSQAQVVDLPLLPAVDLSGPLDIPTPLVPILEGLQLQANVVGSIDDLCGPAISSQCAAALDAVGVLVPTTQQAVANAAASITTQTNTQITDFALSGGLLPPTQSPALLQTLSPTLSSFGVSGISHTANDGFQIEGPIGGRTLGFDSPDVGATLGFRLDASRSVGLPADFLTLGAFANYTNSDIDVASTRQSVSSGSGGSATHLWIVDRLEAMLCSPTARSMDLRWVPVSLEPRALMMDRSNRRISIHRASHRIRWRERSYHLEV